MSKFFEHRGELAVVEWKGGIKFVCRSKPGDWFIMDELIFEKGYEKILNYVDKLPRDAVVYDMGANIGLFCLLTVWRNRGERMKGEG